MLQVVFVQTNRNTLEIHLFGGFSVQFDGEPLPPLPSRTGRLLFAYLALNAGTPQQRTPLADLFWPDVTEARARRRLSHVLWQVQDVLEELAHGRSFVRTVGDSVTFDASSSYWLDVEEFSERLDHVERDGTSDGSNERELRRCVELYRGDLLSGYYDAWVIDEQTRLSHRYVTALTRLVESCKARGNYQDALTFARRITHEAPLREDAHREVMRLSVLLGQTSQALEQFERCRSVLAEELGTEPDAETLALAERVAKTRATPSLRPATPRFVSKRLVGRSSEREVLLDELEAALGGRGRFALLEGSPGVGKSRLLAELAADATWRGFTVLWGSCEQSRGSVAYAPIRQALSPQLNPLRVAQLRHRLDPVWLDVAGHALPELATDGTRPASLSGSEQSERMREALARVLLGLAEHGPTLLVIEDLHWADDETLGLLQSLAKQRDLGRLLLVLSFRDQQVRDDAAAWDVVRSIDRDARPRRISLAGLTAFETGELLSEVLGLNDVPATMTAALHHESGGNPLFALELLRALRDTGDLRADTIDHLDVVEIPVTTDVRTLVAGRLATLDDTARAVVDTGAVAGPEFSFDVVGRATALDLSDLAAAIRRLLDANLLEETDAGCRFAHAVTRRVVLGELPPAARRNLHEAVGDAIAELEPDRIEDLAHHFAEADQPRRARDYAMQAAERALSMSAYATAARHLQMADELMRATAWSVTERFTLLARWEAVLDVLGDREQQHRVLDELAGLGAGERSQRVIVLERQALYLGHVDDFAEAERYAQQAAALTAEDAGPDHVRARMLLGQLRSWAGDNTGAVAVLSEVADQLPDDDPSAPQLRFVLGTALRFVQAYDHAETQLRRAIDLAERAEDQRVIVQSLGALADLHSETGRTSLAVDEYDRAIDLARQIGYRHREGVSLVNRGNLLWTTGRPADAADSYDSAEEIFTALGNHRGVAMARLNRAWLRHRWFGDDEGARTDAEQARSYFTEVGNRGSEAICREILASIARRHGDNETARAQLDRALQGARDASEHRAEIQVLRGMAELLLATGDPSGAAEHAAAAREIASEIGLVDVVADVATLEALATVDHDPSRAWRCVEAATDALADALEPHRIHQRIAQIADRSGRVSLAAEHAAAARRHYQSALTGLTEREFEVATAADHEHVAILAVADAILPRELDLPMAPIDAPRGRVLQDDELITVHLRLGPSPSDRDTRRRQILDVLTQASAQGASPTVAGLASLFDVSQSTVKRDLTWLRRAGHDAETRGTGIG